MLPAGREVKPRIDLNPWGQQVKKVSKFIMLGSIAMFAMTFAGTGAKADVGVGACVAGTGSSVTYATPEADAFAGVNVGLTSSTGIYDSQGAYEAECCAETGSPPDCFEPVE